MKGTANLWLIGLWLWVFDTAKYDGNAKVLKQAGFRWNPKRSAWTWKPYAGKGRSSKYGIEDIAGRYGAKRFEREEDDKSCVRV